MSGPFKMKNSALKMSAKSGSPMQANYASPAKGTDHGVEGHKHDSEGEHIASETRTKDTVTKTKGDKTSTYRVTNTEIRDDGSKKITLTNDEGNSYTEIHS